MGAIILIWPRLNQVSDLPKLQNYSLGGDRIESEFSLIAPLPEEIWLLGRVLSSSRFSHQVGTHALTSSAAWK